MYRVFKCMDCLLHLIWIGGRRPGCKAAQVEERHDAQLSAQRAQGFKDREGNVFATFPYGNAAFEGLVTAQCGSA